MKEAAMADEIKAEKREVFGKGAARKLRAAGRTPAVIYGLDKDPNHVTFDAHQIYMEVRSNLNAVLTLNVDGAQQLALVKDVQINPLSREIEHVDMLRVRADQKVDVEVPLELEGEPFGGAVAALEIQDLLVQAPATAIPERIVISVQDAEDGAVIRVADLVLPEGVSTSLDPEEAVVSVQIPREEIPAEESETSEEAAEGDTGADAQEAAE